MANTVTGKAPPAAIEPVDDPTVHHGALAPIELTPIIPPPALRSCSNCVALRVSAELPEYDKRSVNTLNFAGSKETVSDTVTDCDVPAHAPDRQFTATATGDGDAARANAAGDTANWMELGAVPLPAETRNQFADNGATTEYVSVLPCELAFTVTVWGSGAIVDPAVKLKPSALVESNRSFVVVRIVILKFPVAVVFAESATVTVKLKSPPAVAVPPNTAFVNVKPVGSDPVVTAKT